MVFLLLLGLLVLLIISLHYFRREYVSPGVLACLMFIFSVVYSFYNFANWQLMGYSSIMVTLVLVGVGFFVLGTMLPRIRYMRMRPPTITSDKYARIDISKDKIFVAIVIGVSAVLYYLIYLRRTTGHFGLNLNLNASIQAVRSMRQAGDLTDDLSLPTLLNLLIKATQMFSSLFSFVFIYNRVIKKGKQKDFLLLFPTIPHVFVSLLQSNRGNIIQFIVSLVAMWYITWHRVSGWSKTINKKFARKMIIVVIIIAPLFFLATKFMGRFDAKKFQRIDGFYYVSVYVSGGIRNFDLYLKQGGTPCKIFGQETFVSLNNWIFSHFGNGEHYVRHLEFRFENGWGAGNIYTSFRRFYHDFGGMGIVVLSFIQGFVSSIVYEKARRRSNYPISFSVALFSFFAYTVIYMPIDDLFYSSVVAVSGLEKIVLLFIVYYYVFKVKIIMGKSYQNNPVLGN